MKILADENVPGAAVALLRSAGHDVAWMTEEAPGSADADVLRRDTEQCLCSAKHAVGRAIYTSCQVLLVRAFSRFEPTFNALGIRS